MTHSFASCALTYAYIPSTRFVEVSSGEKTYIFQPNHQCKWVRWLCILVTVSTSVRAGEENANDGWNLLSRYLYRDAAEVFQQSSTEDLRLRDLGLAASMLNEPPITTGKIARAEALLRKVMAAGLNDDTGLYASYLVARILQRHRTATNGEIEAAYRAVIQVNPTSAIAQISAAHLALVLLYQRADLPIAARLQAAGELEEIATGPHLPEVALGYYQHLADAAMYYDVLDDRVVEWLEKAHAIGSSDELTQSTLSLQIAETARKTGQREKAIGYYQRFLADAVPTEQRYHTAEVRMGELMKESR